MPDRHYYSSGTADSVVSRSPSRSTTQKSTQPQALVHLKKFIVRFPEHDNAVSDVIESDGLHYTWKPLMEAKAMIKAHRTKIEGEYDCSSVSCNSRKWHSFCLPVHIRHYEGNRYDAEVYPQLCQKCNNWGKPNPYTESYVKRLSDCLKYWNYIPVERPLRLNHTVEPHQERLCGACLSGQPCRRAREYFDLDFRPEDH